MDVCPTRFEAYEMGEPQFTVEAFDEHTAEVNITTLVTLKHWKEMAIEIEKCIAQLGLE